MNQNLTQCGLTQELRNLAAASGLFVARVAREERGLYRVVTEGGECCAELSGKLEFESETAEDYPAVGDWVLLDRMDDASGNAIIHGVLPRKSAFVRKAAGTEKSRRQVVAANVDTVFVCMALGADFNLRRLERYLSIAWDSGAVPVVVLTKADTCPEAESLRLQAEASAPGVDVLVTSGTSENGAEAISPYLLPGRTIAFVGSSGVGKSTLINALLGENRLATGETSGDEKGRHTTTHRELLPLPCGAVVIDTPGMRELGLSSADLSRSFSDIEELAHGCRFADCRHENEPHCAVRRAVECGTLPAERLESYHKLQKELLFAERKETMTASQAEKQKVIGMMGSLNAMKDVLKNNPKYQK